MLSIEAKLAQGIVERAMNVIPFNVNVMDRRGIIIGSGKPARIGELHSGAQLALAQKHPVEIDEATARTLPGVKPGVNLPLTVRGEICGVVGLTGDPETVRQFGELVRVTAEMILEQAQLTGELQREKRYREEFVFHLVRQEGTTCHELTAWALRLGIDFASPHAVLLITPDDADARPDQILAELQQFQARLSTLGHDSLSAALSPREFAVIESFAHRPQTLSEAAFARQRLQAMEQLLRAETRLPFTVTMGVALPGIEGVAFSYKSATRTLRIGKQRDTRANAHSFYELSLPVLLSGLEAGWQAEQLRQPLNRLMSIDKRNGTLRHTLSQWFAHNGHPIATANALGIHRNTLDYRLRQIADITGLDLEKTDDRLWLYVALQLDN